jgi:glycosyltransferase involved in cell wall biosynthesis
MSSLPLVVVSTYPPEHCGVGRDAFAFVQALRASRPVSVVGNVVAGGAPVEPQAVFAWRKNDVRFPWQVLREVRRVAPNGRGIVHVFHHFFLYGGPITILEFPFLLLLLRIGGYRVVVQFQSVIDPVELQESPAEGIPVRPGTAATWALGAFYRWCDRLSDALVVCTASMQDLLRTVYRIAPARVHLVPVGWQPPASDASALPAGGVAGPTVVFHGFLDVTKGLDDLIEAVAELAGSDRDLRLVFAGEVSPHLDEPADAFVDRLRDHLARRQIAERASFTGYLDPAALKSVLGAADIVVLPYTMRFSHGGSAVLSRVAGLGRPLVATRISRFSDELHDGVDALLVPPSDPAALAGAIRRLRTEPGLAARLGQAVRALAERRGWDRSAERVQDEVYGPLELAAGASP